MVARRFEGMKWTEEGAMGCVKVAARVRRQSEILQ